MAVPRLTIGLGAERPPEPVDRRLAKALAHPLRVQILTLLDQQVLSPAQFARRYRISVGSISYHFHELHRLGFLETVELTKRRSGRGSPQHYRAVKPDIASGADWAKLGEIAQTMIGTVRLQDFISSVVRAITSGSFDARKENHFRWAALSLDQRGWRDLNHASRQLLRTVTRIEREATERLTETDQQPIPATFALAAFPEFGG